MSSAELASREAQSMLQATTMATEVVEVSREPSDNDYDDSTDVVELDEPWEERQVLGQDKMFSESTHSYLIYFRQDADPNGLISSIFVLFLQFVVYRFTMAAAKEEIQKAFLLPVKMFSSNCDGGKPNKDAFNDGSIFELSCEAAWDDWQKNEGSLILSFMLASILFVIFVQYDFIACFKVIRTVPDWWAKVAAIVVLIESLVAFMAGVAWASVGVFHASSYEAVANTIGILFVHDLDEKMFESISKLDSEFMDAICCCFKRKDSCCSSSGKQSCCNKYRPTCCLFLLIVISWLVGLCVYLYYATLVFDENEFKEHAADEWGWYDWYYDDFNSTSSTFAPNATMAPN